MLARSHFFSKIINYLPWRNRANELLTSMWVLSGNEPFVLFVLYFSLEIQFFSEPATPASFDFTGLAVVVLLSVGELLLVISVCLARRDGSAHRHHDCLPRI